MPEMAKVAKLEGSEQLVLSWIGQQQRGVEPGSNPCTVSVCSNSAIQPSLLLRWASTSLREPTEKREGKDRLEMGAYGAEDDCVAHWSRPLHEYWGLHPNTSNEQHIRRFYCRLIVPKRSLIMKIWPPVSRTKISAPGLPSKSETESTE